MKSKNAKKKIQVTAILIACFASVVLFQNFSPPVASEIVFVGYSTDKISEIGTASGRLDKVGLQLVVNPDNDKNRNVTRIVLEKGRVYNNQIVIKHSNVVLDCNHAILDGGGKLDSGIHITGALNSEQRRTIKNVIVRNCIFRNYANGIRIENSLTTSGLRNPNLSSAVALTNWIDSIQNSEERIVERNSIRDQSPRNISIENVKIENTGLGIYVGPYVNGVVITDSTVTRTTIGAHLSYGSQKTRIQRSVFSENGLRGTPGSDREAIVMDSSSHNVISHNVFANNFGAAIRTYKNCGEAAPNLKGVKEKAGKTREEGADFNLITNNSFYLTNSFYKKHQQENYQAISIAARQSRNSLGWMCSDGFYYVESNKAKVFGNKEKRMIIKDKEGKFNYAKLESVVDSFGKAYEASSLKAYARDYSRSNIVTNNSFRNYGTAAISIQDDQNKITNNMFKQPGNVSGFIVVGSRTRNKIDDPIIKNKVEDNCVDGAPINPSLIHGSDSSNNIVSSNKCGYVFTKLQTRTP